MPAIGITGGVATGKSTFVNCLRELLPSARFFDADVAAREVVNLPEVRKKLVGEFGETIFSGTGDLNRDALRAIVFQDAAKKSALEQILHPPIRQQWQAIAETHRNSTDFFFADIPLLYETGGETLCDRVVVVACSNKIQLERLRERFSKLDDAALCSRRRAGDENATSARSASDTEAATGNADAESIINSQMPVKEKIKRADHVVWNNGDKAGLMEQAGSLVALWRLQTDH